MAKVPPPPMPPLSPLKFNFVTSAPEPRRVTLLFIEIPEIRLYVPAFNFTACPLGQLAMAELIWAAVAPGFNVAQIVVRSGIPPVTPAGLQSMLRLGSMMPDQGGAACAAGGRAHN